MDLVALDYACMLNGVTQIVMTKADVLDSFEELQVCTSYNINGKPANEVPYQMAFSTIEPQYQSFKGWNEPSSQMKDPGQLPEAMTSYINFINEKVGVKVRYISNGPGRDQIVQLF
jgi:adenylosuccinate synthase